ncbi:DNA glycosylase AlkZ-like family protein [Aestuariimicrobium sp. T2.26MG-19.2B]|uniref:DNA glycosylase AlkZ-like family protein n=1 Tax=Aestuariimicrobium sp. T2.26MG-19.2B TaxID=3040679 RepID=UPI00247780D9|nr:crosslink repair DNA glycosylase YcaQ family protein [Aestuariimicrobium sp. T2.26MG-19.2B]CAI9409637.1 hypothetical protein AESSP_02275 [Aestuariimicrobium sp. T2.26MG-19.2B]
MAESPTPLHLSAAQARRIALTAQCLTARRPSGVVDTVDRLAAVQVDLTSHVAPNVELVLWSRLGDGFDTEQLGLALERRELVEIHGFLRPADDFALFRAQMDAWPGPHAADWQVASARWLDANARARDDILQTLRSEGPLRSGQLPQDGFVRPWRSSGWNSGKNVQMMLERLEEAGQVAVSHREGRERVWDLAERIYPEVSPVALDDAPRLQAERRLGSMGLLRATSAKVPGEPNDVGEIGVEALVEGVRGRWRLSPDLVPVIDDLSESFSGRTALLSPLDRLIFDRRRMAELFEFDYTLEMYKPAASRRWGYFALPVLHGDRLVGKVDAEADRRGGFLRVHAVHRDEPWAPGTVDDVERELEALARMLGLLIEFE